MEHQAIQVPELNYLSTYSDTEQSWITRLCKQVLGKTVATRERERVGKKGGGVCSNELEPKGDSMDHHEL